MPSVASVKQLTKVDHRQQWKGLKSKHSKAIAKAKLDFDEKLGPALDKYQTAVDKLLKLSATTELVSNQVQPVLEAELALKKIVASYHDKVKTLEDPAKKEMTAFLAALEAECAGWEHLTMNTMAAPPKGTTDAQKAAARALAAVLDNIRSVSLTIVTRGERAKVMYEKYKPNPRPEAAALTGHLVESARQGGPAAHEVANAASQVVAGSNYELFKTRAKAAAVAIQRLKDAADEFEAGWSFSATPMTMASDTDAAALHGNHTQLVADCDAALDLITKLP
jgi:hypothetical protein